MCESMAYTTFIPIERTEANRMHGNKQQCPTEREDKEKQKMVTNIFVDWFIFGMSFFITLPIVFFSIFYSRVDHTFCFRLVLNLKILFIRMSRNDNQPKIVIMA